jgi:phage regulatory protein, rha family|nr:MAG TPA: regulatory protein [Caudoviricetes sp.]
MENIMDLVKIERNKNHGLVVSSRIIAKGLGRRHSHVIRDLENILETSVNSESPNLGYLIFPNEYKVSGQKREYKEYLLTENGFILYMFNIQGHNDFKIAYINEFNRMKAELKGKKTASDKPKALTYDGERVITLKQLHELTGIDRMGLIAKSGDKRIITGQELKKMKQDNGLARSLSCLSVFNREEALTLVSRFRVGEDVKNKVAEYFTPDMNLVKNSRHWKRANDMRNEMCTAAKELMDEMKNIDRSIEKLHKIKNNILGSIQIMNYDMHELEK